MKKLFTLIIFSFAISTGFAQFTTPTIDASLDGGGLYPTNYVSGTPTWYMTWNNTDLFVFVKDANQGEPVSIYLDVDPLPTVNGGTDADGTLVGLNNRMATHLLLTCHSEQISVSMCTVATEKYYAEMALVVGLQLQVVTAD